MARCGHYLAWLLCGAQCGAHHLLVSNFAAAILHGHTIGGCGFLWLADLLCGRIGRRREDRETRPDILAFVFSAVSALILARTYAYLLRYAFVFNETTEDVRDLEDDGMRNAALALTCLMTALAGLIAYRANGIRVSFLPVLLLSTVGIALLSSAPQQQQGSAVDDDDAAARTTTTTIDAAGLTAVVAPLTCWLLRFFKDQTSADKAPSPPRSQPRPLTSCVKVAGSLLAVFVFWVSVLTVALLHIRLPIDAPLQEGGIFNPTGLHSAKLGPFVLQHRGRFVKEVKSAFDWWQKRRASGSTQGTADAFFSEFGSRFFREFGSQWASTGGHRGNGGGGGGGGFFRFSFGGSGFPGSFSSGDSAAASAFSSDCALLELREDCATSVSLSDLKQAHRSVLKKVHPDRLTADHIAASGLTAEEAREKAAAKFREAQAAFERLERRVNKRKRTSS